MSSKCYPYLVPVTSSNEYDLYNRLSLGPCPSGQTNYALMMGPGPGMLYFQGCMTPAQAKEQNEGYCGESFEEPKMADQNSKCDGNNFIESETGYRQATQCVCAPYKSSHIHFVT